MVFRELFHDGWIFENWFMDVLKEYIVSEKLRSEQFPSIIEIEQTQSIVKYILLIY